MGKKLAFWGDCNGYGYKIIRILEKLGGINVLNYGATEVTSLYYIDKKNHIKGTYNGDLDKEKYVIMTYQDFITKYPFQVGDIVYTTDNHEEGKIVEILWDETKGLMRYLVDFENTTSWVFVDDIFSYEAKDNSKCGTAIKPMKVKSNAVKLVDGKVVDNSDEGKTMNKKLAIRGHATRGKEVIELLGMLGAKNNCACTGYNLGLCYLIDDEFDICAHYFGYDDYEDGELNIFTLEEFLEKYPFKIGDLVDRNIDYVSCIIDDMRWNSEKCCVEYHLIYLNGSEYGWHVSDCLIKPKNVIIGTKIESTGFMQMGKTVSVIFNSENYEDEVELQLGDYEIEVRDGKTYAVKKKPVYPKTYEECCRVLGISDGEFMFTGLSDDEYNLFDSFVMLKRCRDAYWKITGEEMGLGKPWEPDWTNLDQLKYCIWVDVGEFITMVNVRGQHILAFPTEEMRDVFYENFKDLIEQCKKML